MCILRDESNLILELDFAYNKPHKYFDVYILKLSFKKQIISEDISELQKNQTTTMAKIAQYKRKLMDLSHRTLQVGIWNFF